MRAVSNIAVLAKATFLEAVRGKQILATLILAAALVVAMTLFGMVTLGDHVRVVKDFGLFATSLASVTYACIAGASFLEKELSRKTIYNILGRAVSRWHFIVGKYLGLILTGTALAAVIMCSVALLSFAIERRLDTALIVGFGFVILELSIVCASTLFFSSIVVTPMLSGLFAFGLFLAGRSADYLLYFVDKNVIQGFGATMLRALYWLLPNLSQLNIADQVTFGEAVPITHFIAALSYSLSYSCLLLWSSCILFSRRDFN